MSVQIKLTPIDADDGPETLHAREIDALKERNLELQNQVNMQNLAASQVAQTQQIITALTPAGV